MQPADKSRFKFIADHLLKSSWHSVLLAGCTISGDHHSFHRSSYIKAADLLYSETNRMDVPVIERKFFSDWKFLHRFRGELLNAIHIPFHFFGKSGQPPVQPC